MAHGVIKKLLYIIIFLCVSMQSRGDIQILISLNGSEFCDITSEQMTTLSQNWDVVAAGCNRTSVSGANTAATAYKNNGGAGRLYARGNTNRILYNDPGKEFDDCDADEDLFEHDIACPCNSSDRMRPPDGTGNILMDTGDAGWRTQVVTWYNELSNYDGLFLDNGSATVNCSGWDIGCPDGYSAAQWKTNQDETIEYAAGQISTVVFNGLISWYADNNYADLNVDGGAIENCILGVAHPTPDHAWIENNLNTMLDATGASKINMCSPKDSAGDPFTETERVFILAGYLLVQDTTYSYFGRFRDTGTLDWWPENNVDIGVPIGSATQMSDLLDASGLYVKEYTNGLVLFNDTGSSHNYTLVDTKNSLTFSGGGSVPSDGSLPGSIIKTQVYGEITVPDGEAKILQNLPSITGVTIVMKR